MRDAGDEMQVLGIVGYFNPEEDGEKAAVIDKVHHRQWMLVDVLCICHFQLIELSHNVGRRLWGKQGKQPVHFVHVYVDKERVHWSKQACLSVCLGCREQSNDSS